jgi:hypothetical protein
VATVTVFYVEEVTAGNTGYSAVLICVTKPYKFTKDCVKFVYQFLPARLLATFFIPHCMATALFILAEVVLGGVGWGARFTT